MLIDPGYTPVYRAMAFGLLPRWHGRPGDAAKFARRIRDSVGGEDGQIAYFNVAAAYYENERSRGRRMPDSIAATSRRP